MVRKSPSIQTLQAQAFQLIATNQDLLYKATVLDVKMRES